MTSTAMRRLLGAKKKAAPRPVTWIKVRRTAPYVRFVIPAMLYLRQRHGRRRHVPLRQRWRAVPGVLSGRNTK